MNGRLLYPIWVCCVVLLVAACSGDQQAAEVANPSSFEGALSSSDATLSPAAAATPRPSFPTPLPTAATSSVLSASQLVDPLCGQPVKDPSLINRRPLAVKIDNAPVARPQSGLAQACIVYEHIVEAGITRYTAIYLAQDAERVGPIRSGRFIDLGIVQEFDAIFAHFGGNQWVLESYRRTLDADVDLYFDDTLYYRSRFRSAPSNAYSSTPRLRQRAREMGRDGAPAGLSSSRLSSVLPTGGEPASHISLPYSISSRVEYRYDDASNSYKRFLAGQPHLDEESGAQLRVTNVVVQYVVSHPTAILDSNGRPTLRFDTTGEGKVEVFRDGRAYDGRWTKPSPTERTRFLDEKGDPIELRPGNTWVSIVHPATAVRRNP